MGAPAKMNFKIYQGSTFEEILRLESAKKVYKLITGITQAAPVVITSVGHAIPNNWRVKITNVVGMKEINNSDDYVVSTLKTVDTIEINSINSLGYTAYTSGGVLEYNEPVDLTGYTARMQIREKLDSTTFIKELTTENGGIIIDNTAKTITLYISAADTALLTILSSVYSLELIDALGKVSQIISGNISLIKEVTR